MWVISFFEISASLFEWVSPSNKYHTLKRKYIVCMNCIKLMNWNSFPVKMDPTFGEKGFRNWKKLPEAFTNHETSEYHRNYVKLLND